MNIAIVDEKFYLYVFNDAEKKYFLIEIKIIRL